MKPFIKTAVKAAVSIAVICGIGAGVYLWMDAPLEVKLAEAETGVFEDTFTENGVVKSGNDINCISEVSGTILSVNAKKNSRVSKGDVIAVVDSGNYKNERQQHIDAIAALRTQISSAKQNESYDKKDIQNSINELEVELASIENARKKARVANTMETSPETYLNNLKADVDAAQGNVDAAALSVTNNEEKVSKQETISDSLYSDYQTKEKLYNGGIISKNEFDAAHREYTAALSDLEDARIELNSAKAALNTAQNALDTAQRAYDNALSRAGDDETDEKYYGYTEKDFDIQEQSVRTKINSLKAKLSNDYSSMTAEGLSKQISAEEEAVKLIDKKIEKCTLTAACDGIITDLPAENMTVLSEGDMVAVIKCDAVLCTEVNVLTSDVPYLNVGDPVVIVQRLKNDKREFSGTISEIYAYAEKGISALGTDEYRTKVIAVVDDENTGLNAGYSVEVRFAAYHSDNALTIPNSALFKVDDKDCIYVERDGKAVLTEVKTAYKGALYTEIRDGISAGDVIVVDADAEGLEDGVKITG